jgi:uncharacterized RDD family membrane protein YckC
VTDTAAPLAPPAELDRRCYAFVVDRLVAWALDATAAYLAYRYLVDRGHPVAGALVVLGAVLLVGAVLAVVLGLTGSSPGRAAAGIRVVGIDDGAPIGAAAALRRQLVLGLATLPTFGLGAAMLAWTAVAHPGGRRHGWHDRLAGSEVVDVRAPRAEPATDEAGPRHVVNLTALRLVPAPPPPPTAPPPAPVPRRQQLGYPLVPEFVAPPASAPPARWRVRFDSGESLVVAGPVLVGRRPEARAGEPVQHLVPLRSTDMSLSKTHARLHVDAEGVLVVTDRGSTNGSILLREGAARELPVGRPTTLLDGDLVRFGDREMRVVREDPTGPDHSVTVR